MAILVAVLLLIYCVFIFFPYQIVLNFGIFIFILVAQFIIFKAASVFRSEQFSSNSAHASYKTFAIWVIGALCFVTLAILLQQFSSYTIVQSISITLAQIITPFIILFGVAIIGAAVFLPAYIAENGEDFSIIDFIKAFGIRIPKFIASLPFVGFGAIVATIIPVIITLVLYSGIETISQSTVQEYANETKVLYTKNHKKIESAQTLNTLTNTRDSIAQAYEQSIKAAQENLRTAELAKSIIKHNSIHTYTGNVYEGDTQYFTIPLMDGVHSYTWQISDVESETVILNTKTGVQGTSKSTGFSTIWQQAGTFVVTLETQDGNTIQTAVTVLPKAKKTKEETRPHYFVTIEEANKAIANTTTEIEIAKTLQKSEIEAFNKQIESMKTTTKTEFGAILPWFLSSIGYALLLIGLLVMAFIYKVIFFFDLYNYMQQPQYYFQKLYDKLKAKNANQPLLGIFALLCAAALCYVHCTYCC
jgi:hypothetical protein